jgi:hypothetical protein
VLLGEQKTEIAFEGFKYLVLERADQSQHHVSCSKAFSRFLEMAQDPTSYAVKADGKVPVEVHGTILIWGVTTPQGIATAKAAYRFTDVLSPELILRDLHAWDPDALDRYLVDRQRWSQELFEFLRCERRLVAGV